MGLMKTHFSFHIRRNWLLLLLFYFVMALYTAVDPTFSTLLITFIFIMCYLFYYFYHIYQDAQARWLITSKNRWVYVVADSLFILMVIAITYVIFTLIYAYNAIEGIQMMEDPMFQKKILGFTIGFERFLEIVRNHTLSSSLIPVSFMRGVILFLLMIQISTFLLSCVLSFLRRRLNYREVIYLIISFLASFTLLLYGGELFQIVVYCLCIAGNLWLCKRAWSLHEIGG